MSCLPLWVYLVVTIPTCGGIELCAQKVIPAHESNYLLVTITMEKRQVHVGESPKVILMIQNVSDRAVTVNGCAAERFYVQGEKGEPPTTFIERDYTDRLLPGESPLGCTLVASVTLNPGGIFKGSALLSYFYDLGAPGKFTVFAEVASPEGWLRTDPIGFEVLAANSAPQVNSH